MKKIIRTQTYVNDLNAIEAHIIDKGSPQAAAALWLEIDDQVEKLSDPNHPRRKGLIVPGTVELVAHPNYVVYLIEDECSVTVLNVLHVKLKSPP